MLMPIGEGFALFSDLTGIPVHILSSISDIERFCESYQFSSAQHYLTSEALEALYQDLSSDEMISLCDCFHLRFILAKAEDLPLAIGPYCTEVVTEKMLRHIMHNDSPEAFPIDDYLTFRSRFTVMENQTVLRQAQTLLRFLCKENQERSIRHIGQSAKILNRPDNAFVKKPAEAIEERYRIEQEMIDHILAGRANDAIESYLAMERSVAYVKRSGNWLERARIGAHIACTTVRLAAFSAGLPAVLVEKIATDHANAVHNTEDIDGIKSLVQDMIRNFTRAVYLKKSFRYSKLILCMIYTIEHEYQRPLSAADLAQKLDVSVNHLVKHCRQETGITPNAYIRKVRMEIAAQLLSESSRSVQEISTDVGVLDPNYFVKLFKQEFGQTPSAYRAERLL